MAYDANKAELRRQSARDRYKGGKLPKATLRKLNVARNAKKGRGTYSKASGRRLWKAARRGAGLSTD